MFVPRHWLLYGAAAMLGVCLGAGAQAAGPAKKFTNWSCEIDLARAGAPVPAGGRARTIDRSSTAGPADSRAGPVVVVTPGKGEPARSTRVAGRRSAASYTTPTAIAAATTSAATTARPAFRCPGPSTVKAPELEAGPGSSLSPTSSPVTGRDIGAGVRVGAGSRRRGGRDGDGDAGTGRG